MDELILSPLFARDVPFVVVGDAIARVGVGGRSGVS